MASQFYLTHHAHLWIGNITMLVLAVVKCRGIFRAVRCAPHHAIHTQQAQSMPVRMRGGCMPQGLGLFKHFPDRGFTQPFSSLHDRTGRDKGAFAGQQYIQLIDYLTHRHMTKQGHSHDTPHHHFQGESAFA